MNTMFAISTTAFLVAAHAGPYLIMVVALLFIAASLLNTFRMANGLTEHDKRLARYLKGETE